MSINKSTKVRTPCNCGSGLYNISGIPENQCYDCYKGRCACGIHDVLCTKCNKASQKTPCKCGSGLYNISGIPKNQCYNCYKGPRM